MFDFTDYQKRCIEMSNTDLFYTFRSDKAFIDMYEHVTYEQGIVYIEQTNIEILKYLMLFANDRIGSPVKYFYEDIGFEVSPTTLRYIKVLSDLVKLFGSLNGMDIIEIGAGYGGQCRVIHQMFKPKSYTIIDVPEAAKLTERYLSEFAIYPKAQFEHYDLFISNYAFTEIARAYQDLYIEKFINKSDRGYMTCNFYQVSGDMLTFNEILKLRDNFQILEEKPLTSPDNFIYIWK